MPKTVFEPKTLVKIGETRSISSKRSWVKGRIIFSTTILLQEMNQQFNNI